MKSIVKGFLLFAIAAGLMLGVSVMPAAALNILFNDSTVASADLDSGVINGIAVTEADSIDFTGGQLFVGYTRVNGTKTSAKAQGTQFDTYTSDTVMGTPAAEMAIMLVKDGDSQYRELYAEGFAGSYPGYQQGDTRAHPVPENGETSPLIDSLVTFQLEREDTGAAVIRVRNTGNYACTILAMVFFPDTDLTVGWRSTGAFKEAEDERLSRFRVSFGGDSYNMGSGTYGEFSTDQNGIPVQDTHVTAYNATGGVRLAEDAETTFFFRVATKSTTNPRDTLFVTIILQPDSGPDYNARFTRIRHDTGYYGHNDTKYAEGGAEDSVSIWTYVATALVRVQKQDSVYAPGGYIKQFPIGEQANRSRDTIPGSMIVYTITYDNDGNRRADSLSIVDFLDPKVDLFIDSFFNGQDTWYANGIGVDTRLGHARWNNNAVSGQGDTAMVVEFSTRGTGDQGSETTSFAQQVTPFSGVAATGDSVLETCAAIRIRWPTIGTSTSLQRDQIDEGSYSGSNALDSLGLSTNGVGGRHVLENVINTSGSSDSGDCGRIIFAVVIR